jgi:chemotaxis protein CheD
MIYKVGMADAKVAKDGDSLRTLGLGSCVGITLYDDIMKIGGMAHIMLPVSNVDKEVNLAKFADTGVPYLLEMVLGMGAAKARLKAKMAGGAQMFANAHGLEVIRVGPRNIEAVQEVLEKLHIPIVASAVGGNFGRTIELDCQTGKLGIRTAQYGESVI